VAFSSLSNPAGHNAKSVSVAAVDRIMATDFQHRKALQLAKMRSIKSETWKLDFGYKLAPKAKVWTGRGKCFAPFKSVAAIHNEDAMTVFWKFCSGSESIQLVVPDLKRLHERNPLLGSKLKATCVDNCCNVRGVLIEATPGVLVKLDCFHWQQRWDPCLCDTKSEKTIAFRSLMRRAIFVTETNEHNRAKELLGKRNPSRQPAAHEIYKEAKATIPDPELSERRVMAVIQSLMKKDADGELESATTGEPKSRFFKRGAMTLNTIANQLEHVRKGCLSDPTSDAVKIHQFNAKTKKTHTARGTSSLENEWLFIHHHVLSTPATGLARAEKALHNCFEASNDKKRVTRLGEEPEVSARTESLQALHDLASRCGFKKSDLDFKSPECPHSIDKVQEHIGFEHQLPPELEASHGVTDDAVDDEEEESGIQALDSFLNEVDFAEEDTRIDPMQFPVNDGENDEDGVQHNPTPDVFFIGFGGEH